MARSDRAGSTGPFVAACLGLALAASAAAADPFRDRIQPFLQTYCFKCHNAEKSEGELNLTRYASAAMLADDFRQWEHVVTFLTSEEMPPAEAKQPSAAERAELLAVLQDVMLGEARKLAGDPGEVLPRRLSNAEFNYTVRDLTGVDIRPADAFPVDPASGEGFSNTGEALRMSPALVKKYYAAAQQIADHVDFTPDGWSFAPYPVATYSDQKKLHEQALLDFYSRHNVDYEAYLSAAWNYRYRAAASYSATIDDWAKERNLSAKYLRSLWAVLEGRGASGSDTEGSDAENSAADAKYYLRWIRQRWQALGPPEQPADPVVSPELMQRLKLLSADLRRLGTILCPAETPAIVAHAGNSPIEHINRRKKTAAARDTFNANLLSDARRFRVEFHDLKKKPSIRVFLQCSAVEAGDTGPGVVILKDLNFTTASAGDYKPNDEKRNTPLVAILQQHAPDQLERLNVGKHPLGHEIDPGTIALSTAGLVELEIPTAAFPGTSNISLQVDARLDLEHTPAGMARFVLADHQPDGQSLTDLAFPLVNPQHKAADELCESCAALCAVFFNRFCYLDDTRGLSAGFHLIEGFFRDDQPLCRHVLDDSQKQELDRLWNELNFGTHIAERELRGFVFFERSERNFMKHADFDSFKEEDPELVKAESVLRLEQAYFQRSGVKGTAEQLAEHPIHSFFAEIRSGLERRSAELNRAQGVYLEQLEQFAERAYRRPVADGERQELQAFFHQLAAQQDAGVELAVRASILRILFSPYFCYRIDIPSPEATSADAPLSGQSVQPLSDLALASRLSYFLWSSMPDEELLAVAKAGQLQDEAVLRAQTRRMLKDPKVSGFTLEFFGPWLRYRDFLSQESVSRKVFPAFDETLKQAMFEEPTRLATRLIQQDRSVIELLSGDTTLVNKRLAQHYNLPFTGFEGQWSEVAGIRQQGRSGLLGMAVFLTKNSQPQRTSPVKRGFWVVHHLLGEHIPPPPADVVALPPTETETAGKTIRQLMAAHTEDAKCARCHTRFDAIGLAMESFDAIGRSRSKDLAGRPIDNLVELPNGKQASGVADFAQYLAAERADDFTKTLARKLLGYALGRSLLLSDQPLLVTMQARLKENDCRFVTLFETVVCSPQFRNQRSRDFTTAAFRQEPSGD